MRRAVLILVLTASAAGHMRAGDRQGVSFPEVLALEAPPADERIAYGPGPQQLGELWRPREPGPHPVAIVIHGGCWSAAYGEGHIRPVCAALAQAGVAAWCLEYRRVGDKGGGWPGTFEDVGRGADHLREIAPSHGLDLTRVVAVGHSAGGHLALWLAARARLPEADPLRGKPPLPLRGVVGLAPIPDLARAAAEIVVTIGPSVTAGSTLDVAHANWTRAHVGEVRTPSGLPRQAPYARCPAGLVRVSVECIERRSGGMSSYYGFEGYFASLLVSVDEAAVWDARGEPAS
ncbi:MAG TPA: alpha/beta hydrolase [Vicinamibacteria bacterium]|nr:alpha/beta hydrolase [Vicinamibacteria bacterium]